MFRSNDVDSGAGGHALARGIDQQVSAKPSFGSAPHHRRRSSRAVAAVAVLGVALVMSGCEVIDTLAGGPGSGTATSVSIQPGGVSYSGGSIYVADTGNSVIRTISSSGAAAAIAGIGASGYTGDTDPASEAELSNPAAVTEDGSGDTFIADTGNSVIRMIAGSSGTLFGISVSPGDIYTIAGNGSAGYTGDDGPATSAQLNHPQAVALDSHGNIVIADSFNNVVRVVAAVTGTFYGLSMTAGDIYTVAGDQTAGYSGDNGPATSAELGGSYGSYGLSPLSIALDSSGNIVVGDAGNDRVRVVAASTGTFYGKSMTVGDIYTVAGNGTGGTSGNGGSGTSAEIGDSSDLLNGISIQLNVGVDSHGNLLISDAGHNEVRVLAESSGTYYGKAMTSGDIYLVAGNGTAGYSGDGSSAASAELDQQSGVTADASGNLIIADTTNNRVRVVATTTGTYYGVSMTAGDIYTVGGNGFASYSGNGGTALDSELSNPTAIAVDSHDNVVFADSGNNVIRVDAQTTGTYYGQSMTAGDIYTIAGNGTSGYSGDNGPALSAELSGPQGVAVDGHGNVIISDNNNDRIRVLAEATGTFYGVAMKTGDIYTVVGNGTAGATGNGGPGTSAEVAAPGGVTVDPNDNVVIADNYNNVIRVLAGSAGTFYGQAMKAGDIYVIAGNGTYGEGTNAQVGSGGPALSAEFANPEGVAFDGSGNLVVSDTGGDRIWIVAESTGTFFGTAMTAGDAYVIAGDGNPGYEGDEGSVSTSEVNGPMQITVDSQGNILFDDSANDVVRIIPSASGEYYGDMLNADDIYTIVGNGTPGFSGEEGFPADAQLDFPEGVGVDLNGNMLIGDTLNNRIRALTVTATPGVSSTVSTAVG